MNLSNILTGLRFILVIPFIIYLLKPDPVSIIISFIIYLIASITDYFDGYFARKLNVVSKIGAFLDPLADKILVITAFAIFSLKKFVYLPFYFVIILAFRDYFITVLRIEVDKQKEKGNSNKKEFKTSFAAKFKTAFQMITIIIFYFVYLVNINYIKLNQTNFLKIIPLIFFTISLLLTYYSAIKYVLSYLKESYITLVKSIATFFYLGYLTKFPGTFVTLIATIIIFFLNFNLYSFLIILVIIIILGIISSNIVEKIENVIDPGYITIDEISGILVSLFPFYLFNYIGRDYFINNLSFNLKTVYLNKWIYFCIAFILFRFFDIIKPLGIKKIQKIKGGVGIMIDDFLAGIYVAIIMGTFLLF